MSEGLTNVVIVALSVVCAVSFIVWVVAMWRFFTRPY